MHNSLLFALWCKLRVIPNGCSPFRPLNSRNDSECRWLRPDTIGESKLCLDFKKETASVVCANNRGFVVFLEMDLFLKTLNSEETRSNLTA